MAELASFTATVYGRVQGVNFRSFVKRCADSLNLTGYARNLQGGKSVEIHAEGEKGSLVTLLEKIHKGPAFARVEQVDVKWQPYTGLFTRFATRF